MTIFLSKLTTFASVYLCFEFLFYNQLANPSSPTYCLKLIFLENLWILKWNPGHSIMLFCACLWQNVDVFLAKSFIQMFLFLEMAFIFYRTTNPSPLSTLFLYNLFATHSPITPSTTELNHLKFSTRFITSPSISTQLLYNTECTLLYTCIIIKETPL